MHNKWTRGGTTSFLMSSLPPLRNTCDAGILHQQTITSQRVVQHTSWEGPERRYTHKSLKDTSALVVDSSGTHSVRAPQTCSECAQGLKVLGDEEKYKAMSLSPPVVIDESESHLQYLL